MINKLTASIIILNYNGEKIIRNTIDSLLALDYPHDSFEIIIVDNGSKDKSRKVIEQFTQLSSISNHQSPITNLFLKNNLGFAGGNNVGIQKAKGTYVILLNNDCIVHPEWLKELIAVAESDENIFSVNSKILLYNTDKIQNAGIIPFYDGYCRDIGAIVQNNTVRYEINNGLYDTNREIYATCGAAVCYRKKILDKIGYLNDSFFLYYEDVEISERARLHGYINFYASKAIVYHHHAASSKESSSFFIYHVERGRLLHILFHFPLYVFFVEYIKFLIIAKLRMLKDIIRGKNMDKSFQYLRAMCSVALFFVPYIIKRIQLHKTIKKNAVTANYQSILKGIWLQN